MMLDGGFEEMIIRLLLHPEFLLALLRLSKLPGEERVVDAFCCMLGAERGGGDSGGSESVIVLEGRSSRVVDSKFSSYSE